MDDWKDIRDALSNETLYGSEIPPASAHAKSLSTTTIDDWEDVQNALSNETLYGSEFPPARADARVTIESLPTELLAQVVNHSKNKSILSLMRVNHLFHSVSLRKFYANVFLPGNSFAKNLIQLDPTLSAEDLLPSLYHKKFGVLGGLLRSKHHIAVLKSLRIVSFPSPLGPEHTIFNRLLRYIVENATTINEIHLPFANITPSTIFDGLVVSPSLDSLNSHVFHSDLAKAILRTGQLRSLRMTYQCATSEDWQTVASQMPLTLRHLECFLHVTEGQWGESAAGVEAFASKLSRLETLKFGYCDCVTAASPEPEIPLQNYTLLASAIPSLTSLTIVDRRNGSFQRRSDIQHEATLISSLSHANTNLRSITVYYMYRTSTSNFDDGEKGILWTAAPASVAEVSRDAQGQMRLWTPAPHLRSRWRFWHDTFGDAETAVNAMKMRWSEDGGEGGGEGGGGLRLGGDGVQPRGTTRFPTAVGFSRSLSVMQTLERFREEANQ